MNSVVIWVDKFKGFSLMASIVLLAIGMTSEGTFVSSLENAYAQHGSTNMTTPGRIMTGEGGMQHESGQGMSGMGGMTEGGGEMEHGGGQGMSGMGGMTEGGGEMEHGGGQGMSGMGGMTEGGGEMEHGGGQGMSGMGGMTEGGGEMEHGGGQGMSGMGGMEHGGGHTPGMTNEMCHMGEDMPPHYCEPSYQVMSSVKGVKISDVNILNDTSVMVSLSELNPMSNNTVEDIVIVGGAGDLAGSTILEGNWKQNTTSTLNFVGTGSVYSTDKLTVHIFPFNG